MYSVSRTRGGLQTFFFLVIFITSIDDSELCCLQTNSIFDSSCLQNLFQAQAECWRARAQITKFSWV